MQCARKLSITVRSLPGLVPSDDEQWVEASDLEAEAQEERPKEFHAAWQAICTAKYVALPSRVN